MRDGGWRKSWVVALSLLLMLVLTSVAVALLGDVDDDTDIDVADAQLVLESVIGVTTLTGPQAAAADVDCNNVVDVADAQLIQQVASGQLAAFPPCRPKSSGPIALTRKGDLLGVVNPDSDSVTFLETVTDSVLEEVAVGREPTGIAFSRDGKKAYVTLARDAKVAVLDTVSRTVVGEISVGVEPFAVVVNHQGDRAFVSNMSSATISIVDTSTDTVIGTATVAQMPQGIAVDADSAKLYVTHLRRPELSVVDTSTLGVTSVPLAEIPFDEFNTIIPAGVPNRVKGIAIHPILNEAWVPHMLSNSGNFVETLFNTSIFPAVSVIDTTADLEIEIDRMTLFSGISTVVSSPESVAFSPDGMKAFVVSASSDDLTVMDTTTRQEIGLVRDVGDNPRGVVIHPDGLKAYVFNRLTPQVSVVDLTSELLTSLVPVSTDPLPANIANGRRLFFSSAPPEVAQDRFFSCEACHFDGRDDAQTWFFTNGPRQTLSMEGDSTNRTGLLHHSGDRGTVQDFDLTFTRLQNGTGVTPDQLNDLADFVNTGTRALGNPFLNPDGSRTAAARTGRRVFETANCAGCHSGLFLTDATGNNDLANPVLHDVGIFAVGSGSQDETDKTRDQDGTAGGTLRPAGSFESTFLTGGWATDPYLHDGRSLTLLDVLTTDNPTDLHGTTSGLTPQELSDLDAYLRESSLVTARVAIRIPADGTRAVDLLTVSGDVLDDVLAVDVVIDGQAPIPATVNAGTFSATVPVGTLASLGLPDGQTFDITAIATAPGGDFGRDDVELEVNLGGVADPANSTVEANPSLISADAVSKAMVVVSPRDGAGDLVGSGLTIEVQATDGSVGAVVDLGDGRYQVLLTSTAVAGVSTVTANVQGGATFIDTAQVTFAAGSVDATLSSAIASPTVLEADGVSTSTITITPRDAFGNNLGSGQSVSAIVDNGSISSPVDQGNGTYTAIYTADVSPGVATVTASVGATALDTTPSITLNADVTAPDAVVLSRITFAVPAAGDPQVTGGPGAAEALATVHVENTDTAGTANPVVAVEGSFGTALPIGQNDEICFQVEDLAGNMSPTVCTVPFEVLSVRGVYQTAAAGGGFTPIAGAFVQLSDTNLSVPASPGFTPLVGYFDTTAGDGSFEILATGLGPDPGDLSVITGPDANMDNFVDGIVTFSLVNDFAEDVELDQVGEAQVFLVGNCSVLGCPTVPANCHLNVTVEERAAIETSLRAATTEIDFTTPPNATQLIANDVFFDADGPKDALDATAFGTFCGAIEAGGSSEPPRIVEGRVTVPSSGGDVGLPGVTVFLASYALPSQGLTTLGPVGVTDSNGDYALSLPAFVQYAGDLVVIVAGDLTYNGSGVPGPFAGASPVSLANFVTHDNTGGDIDVDVAGRAAMALIAVPAVDIDHFNLTELEQLTSMCSTVIDGAGISLASKTLAQVFTESFNACFFDAGIINFLTEISDAETGGANMTAVPTSIEANGFSISTITVEPLDEGASPVGPGLVVDLTTSLGTISSPAVDNHDGTYTAFLTSPTSTGSATVTAFSEGLLLNSTTVTLTTDVTVPLAPDATRILLTSAGVGTATLIGLPGAVEPICTVTIENTTQASSADVPATREGGFRADFTADPGDNLQVRCTDDAGNVSPNTAMVIGAATGVPSIGNPSAIPGGVTASIAPVAEGDLGVAIPAGFTFLRGFELDLEGSSALAALDVLIDSGVPITPGRQLLLAQVIEVLQSNELRVVSTAGQGGGVLYPLGGASFPGVIEEGVYVYLEADVAQAFVHGTVTGSLSVIEGVYQTVSGSPFTDLTRADGSYLLAGDPGSSETVGSKLFAHLPAEQTPAFLAYGGSAVECDFNLVTRADVSHAFTGRFTGVGQTTRNLELLPSGDQLYVTLNDAGDISILDTVSLNPVSFTEDVQNITDLEFTPNGFEAFIGYFNRARDFKVSIEEPGLLFSTVGFPRSVATTPNGDLALIASSLDNSEADSDPDAIFVIDTFTNGVESSSIAVAADPSAIAVNPAGTRAYTVSRTQGTLTVVDIAGRSAIDTLTLGSSLADVVVSHDGSEVYVSDIVADNVLILDAANLEDFTGGNDILATIAVGAAPGALALSPDGDTLLVAEQQDDTLSRIDPAAQSVTGVLAAVDLPFDVTIHPNGTLAYVVDPLTQMGVLEFPLADVDATAPALVDAGPQDRAVALLQDSPVEIVFTEKMDVATFTGVNVDVRDAGDTPIPGVLIAGDDSVSAIFTPDPGVRYELNSNIKVVLETGLTDTSGNPLASQLMPTIPTVAMQLPNLGLISMPLSGAGIVVEGDPGAVEPESGVEITNLLTADVFTTVAGLDGSFSLGVTGLDDDGYELVTSIFGGRAVTDAVPVLPDFDIVPTDTGLITYQAGLQGTLQAVGAAGAVDPQTSDVVIRNLTSGQSFATSSIAGDGSFSLGLFAESGDTIDIVTTIFSVIELDALPLSVPSFTAPAIDFVTPNTFTFGDPVTLTVVGTDFGSVPGNILLEIGGAVRMDFSLADVDGSPTQQAIQVALPAGADSGTVRVSVAGLSSNTANYFSEIPANTSPFAEEVIDSSINGDAALALGQSDGSSADLGQGGSLTLRMGSTVTNGSGADLQILEDGTDGADCYEVLVSPSSVGPFASLGPVCGNAFIDLGGNDLIRFVQIVDANDGGPAASIDAVFAIRVKMSVTLLIVNDLEETVAVGGGTPPATTPELEPIYSMQVDSPATHALREKDNDVLELAPGEHVTIKLRETMNWFSGSRIGISELDDTCYRILTSDRSVGPYVPLGEYCGDSVVTVDQSKPVRYVRLANSAANGQPARFEALQGMGLDVADVLVPPGDEPIPLGGLTVTLTPPDADICIDESVTLTASVSPAPSGGGGYGGGCTDTISWSQGGVGSITASGACNMSSPCTGSSCKFCGLDSPGTATVTANVTRTGNCSSAGGASGSKTANVNVGEVSVILLAPNGSALDPNPNAGGGMRIFPGNQTAADATDRKKVFVRVMTTPAIKDRTIYFKAFDVDDPSDNVAPVDANGGNGGDNRGAAGAGLSMATKKTDMSGEAEVEFSVSVQPGNNHRIGASCKSDVNTVTDNEVPADNVRDVAGKPGKYSDMLTVWRRVHMELDSMGNVTGNTVPGNITGLATPANSTAATRLNVDINFTTLPSGADPSPNLSAPPGNGRFEMGTVNVAGTTTIMNITGNGNTFLQRTAGFNITGTRLPFTAVDNDTATMSGTVTLIAAAGGNWRHTLNVTANSETPIDWPDFIGGTISIGGGRNMAIVATNAAATTVDVSNLSIPFTVMDDDTGSGSVIAPATGTLVARFAPAYVLPVQDVGDNNTNVAFQLNVHPFAGTTAGYDFDQVATQNTPLFWTIYLLGAYQPETWLAGATPFGDGDAATPFEAVTWGIVDAIGTGQGLRVFSESFNEAACTNQQVTAHEVGHLFNGIHGDGGLMTGGGCPAPAAVFSPPSLNSIRSIVNP